MKKNIIFGFIGLVIGLGAGFALGVYYLPIIVAHENAKQMLNSPTPIIKPATTNKNINYTGAFNKNAKDSDFFHWGTGDITIKNNIITFTDNVELAPGPDYRLYAIKNYLESEDEFKQTKSSAREIAKITMFGGNQKFVIPATVDISKYDALLIWCEAFNEFITVAKLNK